MRSNGLNLRALIQRRGGKGCVLGFVLPSALVRRMSRRGLMVGQNQNENKIEIEIGIGIEMDVFLG